MIIQNKVKSFIRRINRMRTKLISKSYYGEKIKIELVGGLCNKIHCLISACDIAIENNASIIEPEFGWNKKIFFSDIFDIDYFNNKMRESFGVDKIIIPRKNISKIKEIFSFENYINLWDYSEIKLKEEREQGYLLSNSVKIQVLNALKLNKYLENIVDNIVADGIDLAIQVRTETDWRNYAKEKILPDKKEKLFVENEKIFEMIGKYFEYKKVFFTTGENHKKIKKSLTDHGYTVNYYYNSLLEYEINAAINFMICCNAEKFIGNSRSSFSNLISLKRNLIFGEDTSYIYNYDDAIFLRIDKGLYPVASVCINKRIAIKNI